MQADGGRVIGFYAPTCVCSQRSECNGELKISPSTNPKKGFDHPPPAPRPPSGPSRLRCGGRGPEPNRTPWGRPLFCGTGGGKRHTPPHSAQPQHTNYWAPRTRKRHQQEHRPQRPTESSDPTQHAKGRTGDRPGPRKGATTRRNVTQGGLMGCPFLWLLWLATDDHSHHVTYPHVTTRDVGGWAGEVGVGWAQSCFAFLCPGCSIRRLTPVLLRHDNIHLLTWGTHSATSRRPSESIWAQRATSST